jgi:RimJ/RimL family protein N-acetyltransferase
MIYRPIDHTEVERLTPLIVADAASLLTARQFQIRFERGEYRPEWAWIAEAEPGQALAAAAIWWGTASDVMPAALDSLFAIAACGSAPEHEADGRPRLAARLLAAGHEVFAGAGLKRPPAFHMFLPPDWHDRPDVTSAANWRIDAARRAGLTGMLERLRYEWTAAGTPQPRGQLTFRQEPDDEVFVDLFSRTLTETLDATSRKEAELSGPEAQARRDVWFYRERMNGRRSWWRVAENQFGEVTGFGIPSQNTDVPVVGYLGVLPEHRGHGYADEILAEVTRILVAEAGATRIHADTDLENRPMAAAFDRAGYRTIGRRLVLAAR